MHSNSVARPGLQMCSAHARGIGDAWGSFTHNEQAHQKVLQDAQKGLPSKYVAAVAITPYCFLPPCYQPDAQLAFLRQCLPAAAETEAASPLAILQEEWVQQHQARCLSTLLSGIKIRVDPRLVKLTGLPRYFEQVRYRTQRKKKKT